MAVGVVVGRAADHGHVGLRLAVARGDRLLHRRIPAGGDDAKQRGERPLRGASVRGLIGMVRISHPSRSSTASSAVEDSGVDHGVILVEAEAIEMLGRLEGCGMLDGR